MLYLRKNVIAVVLLGFASGLPLALTAGTLSAWLATQHIDLTTIGLFSLVGLPYVYKFIWAPLVDQVRIPLLSKLGHRRSWLLATEVCLLVTVVIISSMKPQTDITLIALFTAVFAVFAATHDIVIDAYRIEILTQEELGVGASAVTFGYRLGMIVSGAGALYMADRFGWQVAYITMGVLMFTGFLVSFLIGEMPYRPREHRPPRVWFKEAVIDPFADFIKREHWLLVLLFVVAYKLPDAFVVSLISPFLIELGFTLTQIALVVKAFGIAATIAGVLASGWLISHFGMMRSLMLCAALQMASNLVFIYQARAGADIHVLYATVAVENLTSGMATGVFVAYISALCKLDFTATQYALFSSFAAIGRSFLASGGGYLSKHYGWENFFVFCALLPLISIIMLQFLKEPTALAESRKHMPAGKQALKVKLQIWQKAVLFGVLAALLAFCLYYIATNIGNALKLSSATP
jgi:PAT family beta-lactamase induction signal transducer AmpG